jgi:hypothetical protein
MSIRDELLQALGSQARGKAHPEWPKDADNPNLPAEKRAAAVAAYAGELLSVPVQLWTKEDVALVKSQVSGVLNDLGR